ncbi:MAG: hypothetical protein RL748_2677 [Pseudomonadota bacterium]|jgi:uncharacterized protein (TIGR02646 family)
MIHLPDNGPSIDLATRLKQLETKNLAHLRALGREPVSDDIKGYDIARDELFSQQKMKCCYCEYKPRKPFNPVEHYRPKAEAKRKPGSTDRHGYWWLAWNWDNLLFSCQICNSSAKGSHFPLAHGSTALQAEEMPPGKEQPLLLNPRLDNPVLHLQFIWQDAKTDPEGWYVHPLNASERGEKTIEIMKLNAPAHLDARTDYLSNFMGGLLEEFNDPAKTDNERTNWLYRALGFLGNDMPYTLLAYDVLRHAIPDSALQNFTGTSWPSRAEIGSRTSKEWRAWAKQRLR